MFILSVQAPSSSKEKQSDNKTWKFEAKIKSKSHKFQESNGILTSFSKEKNEREAFFD